MTILLPSPLAYWFSNFMCRLEDEQQNHVVAPQPQPRGFVAASAHIDSLNHQVEKLIQQLEAVKRTTTPVASTVPLVPKLGLSYISQQHMEVFSEGAITPTMHGTRWRRYSSRNCDGNFLLGQLEDTSSKPPSRAQSEVGVRSLCTRTAGGVATIAHDAKNLQWGSGLSKQCLETVVNPSRARLLAKYASLPEPQRIISSPQEPGCSQVTNFNPVFVQKSSEPSQIAVNFADDMNEINSNLLANLRSSPNA